MLVHVFIDDRNGSALLKEAFAGHQVPEFMADVTPDSYEGPFALVVKEAGSRYGKYPCGDEVSAYRSLHFLQKTASTLPEDAVKIAATNLIYCLQKEGNGIPYEIGEFFGVESSLPPTKEAAMALDAQGLLSEVVPVNPEWSADGRHLSAVVKEAMPESAEDYALVKESGAYFPIDNIHRLQQAIEYFEKNAHELELYDRAVFSYNVANRAHEVSMPLPDDMRKYAGEGFSPDLVRTAFFNRRQMFPDTSEEYKFAKSAEEQCHSWDRSVSLTMLEDFDRETGLDKQWGGRIKDPYLSTHKLAESDVVRVLYDELGTRMTLAQLKDLVKNPGYDPMMEILPVKARNQIKLEPEAVFQSLPDDLKRQIAHIAADNSDGGHR